MDFKNKFDESGIVTRNKARLITKGHNQEEGIDFDKNFALVDGLEAIHMLVAFTSHMGTKLFQIDMCFLKWPSE